MFGSGSPSPICWISTSAGRVSSIGECILPYNLPWDSFDVVCGTSPLIGCLHNIFLIRLIEPPLRVFVILVVLVLELPIILDFNSLLLLPLSKTLAIIRLSFLVPQAITIYFQLRLSCSLQNRSRRIPWGEESLRNIISKRIVEFQLAPWDVLLIEHLRFKSFFARLFIHFL